MTTTYTTNARLTIAEVVKRMAPDGNLAAIAEVLQETNDILQDIPWRPANDYWSNKTTRRASLPNGTSRKFNQGVDPEWSETVNVTDPLEELEAHSEIDTSILDGVEDKAQARSDEDMAFVEGLGQTMAYSFLYNDSRVDPEKMTGLEPRLDTLNSSAYNVVSCSNSSASINTSIYVVDWGPNTVFGAYPKGTQGGLRTMDMGVQRILDAYSKAFLAYMTVFKWQCGLVVRNHRSIGRLCNVAKSGASKTFDENNLIILMNRMTKGKGRRIYVNEDIMSQMQIRLKDKSNVNFTRADGLDGGGPVMMFNGVPIRQVDQIANNESVVS